MDHCAAISVTSSAVWPVEYVIVYSSSGVADPQLVLAAAAVRAKFSTLSGIALSSSVASSGNATASMLGVFGRSGVVCCVCASD